MPPKGLSLEEKRKRLETIFHESKDFFQLKEVEKLGSKRQIVLQTVKDVLQSLVDDGLVKSEKIGTSNYYWSFPSEAKRSRETTIESLQTQLADYREKIRQVSESIETETAKRKSENEDEQDETFTPQLLAQKESMLQSLQSELASLNHCNPETIALQEKMTMQYLEAANLWTDQTHSLLSFCKDMGAELPQILQACDIPEDLDELTLPVKE
ncbi:meiosis specific coiled-coil protein Mcp7 [Schizosaccharomyces osmophilus]|uniref:Meiosis specific coiled-coil protein Mcp7 n=1 Tax=Schizosaccharomyces osmophilus TaxID=2545709 RepID=A0AAE9W8B7_9SCHI|nr:meiosis specific coiled-coil protein Mcp7 [Schizosaccharomyces osmophilus]WBW71610.1 meiosis specific coiled-coil protein Mcp7 [Schizosaccharomyces osmophilus]